MSTPTNGTEMLIAIWWFPDSRSSLQ